MTKEERTTLKTAVEILKREALAGEAGDNIILRGFGTFKVGMSKARKGRNPHTGAELDIPARKTFKLSVTKGWLV